MAPRRKESSSEADSSGKTSPDVSGADTFPCKAFQVIQYCEKNDPNVASWSRDGTYFVVKDTATFSSSHLPRYFKHSNFQSFNRQLNIYGFRIVKEHDNSDGSVAFSHRCFQRERHDLLSNIKRANKKQSGSYNDRFDEMQQEIHVLSEKLDLLISLVTANNNMSPREAIVGSAGIQLGAKRRRRDPQGSELSHVSEMTASTKAESFHSNSSESSRKEGLSTFSETKENTEEQEALNELRESTQELDEIHQSAAILKEEDDDFKMFIDEVLGDGEEADAISDICRQDDVQDDIANDDMVDEEQIVDKDSIENGNDTIMAADPLMSKVTPETVQGRVHIPQSTAVVSSMSNSDDDYEYDEETGAPLTTAVIVTPDASHKWLGHRAKIILAVLVVMVIAAFITWPVVVFGGAKGKNLHYSIDPEDDSGDSVNGTTTETDDDTFENKNAMDTGPFTKSVGDDEQDLSKFELKGDKYECECHQPMKRRDLFHHAF